MANKFATLLEKMGGLFKLGAEKAIALEANPAVQQVEAVVLDTASVLYPPGSIAFQAVLTQIVRVEQIATALNASSGNGAAKLMLVVPEVADMIMSEPIFKGKQPKDLDLFNSGVTDITSGFAKIMNSYGA